MFSAAHSEVRFPQRLLVIIRVTYSREDTSFIRSLAVSNQTPNRKDHRRISMTGVPPNIERSHNEELFYETLNILDFVEFI